MQSQTKDHPQGMPLGEAIRELLKAPHAGGPSIGEILEAVGEKGFGLLLVVLSLPSALPVPAPGYSTPFGVVIALLALQMMCGRSSIWLPERLKKIRFQPRLAETMLGVAARFLKRIERWIRPRQGWIRSQGGLAGLSTVILLMACLMVLPIPLTNTFPAMVIFMLGVGLAEEDGLLALFAFVVGCFALLLYAGVVYVFVTQGPEAIDAAKDWLKGLLGLG